MNRYHTVCFSLAICGTTPASASGDSVKSLQLSTGVYWSQGDYREGINRSMAAIPLAARVQADTWSARLATTLLTSEQLGTEANNKEQKERQSGMGDTWLSATHHLPPQQTNSLFIDLTGKLKWASGNDAKALSSGTTDTELRMDGFKRFDSLTLSSGFGYRWRSGNVTYKNSANAIVGADWRWTPGNNVGVTLSAGEPSTASSSGQREWLIYWSIKRASNTRWTLYALHGTSTSTPDIGAGVTISRAFTIN